MTSILDDIYESVRNVTNYTLKIKILKIIKSEEDEAATNEDGNDRLQFYSTYNIESIKCMTIVKFVFENCAEVSFFSVT